MAHLWTSTRYDLTKQLVNWESMPYQPIKVNTWSDCLPWMNVRRLPLCLWPSSSTQHPQHNLARYHYFKATFSRTSTMCCPIIGSLIRILTRNSKSLSLITLQMAWTTRGLGSTMAIKSLSQAGPSMSEIIVSPSQLLISMGLMLSQLWSSAWLIMIHLKQYLEQHLPIK